MNSSAKEKVTKELSTQPGASQKVLTPEQIASARRHKLKKTRDARLRAKFEKDIAARLRGAPVELKRAAHIAWSLLLVSDEAREFERLIGKLPHSPRFSAKLTYHVATEMRPWLTIFLPEYDVPVVRRIKEALAGTGKDLTRERAVAAKRLREFISEAIMAQNPDIPLMNEGFRRRDEWYNAIYIEFEEKK